MEIAAMKIATDDDSGIDLEAGELADYVTADDGYEAGKEKSSG